MFKVEEADSEAYDWPNNSLGKKLTALEESLLCPICSGHYENPQVLNCGHSFCSICIRKHFDKTINRTTSDICPSCREKADTADLKVNRALASTLNSFKLVRKELFEYITTQHNQNDDEDEDDIMIISDSRNKTHKPSNSSVVITQRIPHYSFHGIPLAKMKKTIEKVTESSRIKLRMDGDKDVLERRLREVIHLNNAQVNATHPLSFDQVIKYVNDKESARESEARKSAGTIGKLEKLKNGQAVKELDTNFATLAKKAHDHKKQQAVDRKTKDAAEQQQSSSSSSTSSSNNTNSEEVEAIPPNLGSAEVMDLLDRPYNWGPFRVVMSNKLGRPFFYNTLTGIGQFAVPPELLMTVGPSSTQLSDAGDEGEGDGEEDSASVHSIEQKIAVTNIEGTKKFTQPSSSAAVVAVNDDEEEENEEEEETFIQSDAMLLEEGDASAGVRSNISTQVDTSINLTQHHMFSDPGFSAGTGTGSGFKLKRSRPDPSIVAAHDVERLFPGDSSDLEASQTYSQMLSQMQQQQSGDSEDKTTYSKSQLGAIRSDSLNSLQKSDSLLNPTPQSSSQNPTQRSQRGGGAATQRDNPPSTQKATQLAVPELFDMTQEENVPVVATVVKENKREKEKRSHKVNRASIDSAAVMSVEAQQQASGRSTRDRARPSRYREDDEGEEAGTHDAATVEGSVATTTASKPQSHSSSSSSVAVFVPRIEQEEQPSPSLSWTCATCTFENDSQRGVCEMCAAPSGRTSKPRRNLQSQMTQQSVVAGRFTGTSIEKAKSGTTGAATKKRKH